MDEKKAANAVRLFLEALDVDIEARGMERTPARVATLFAERFRGIGVDAAAALGRPFSTEAEGLVAVERIPFASICEHHLVPFYGTVDIVYLPHAGKVAGFSRFVSMVDVLARRPQLQERLTHEIADAVLRGIGAEGVLVVTHARQLCMMLKEEGTQQTTTVTSEALGALQDPCRAAEAWAMLGKREER